MHRSNFNFVHPNWLFASVVGSHNYGTATSESDTDMKFAYLPRFEEFYRNRFAHVDKSGPDLRMDYTLHPAHEFMRHAFRGNMNFWEVFFSQSLEFNLEFLTTDQNRNDFLNAGAGAVTDNPFANYKAMIGMAVQKRIEAGKFNQGTISRISEPVAPDYNKMVKAAQHSVRILDTFLSYYDNRYITLNVSRGKVWERWRLGEFPDFDEYNRIFYYKMSEVEALERLVKDWDRIVEESRQSKIKYIDQVLMQKILRLE